MVMWTNTHCFDFFSCFFLFGSNVYVQAKYVQCAHNFNILCLNALMQTRKILRRRAFMDFP